MTVISDKTHVNGASTAISGTSKVVPNNIPAYAETKDFRIAMLGNVDSGKSTLCGVLSRGILDDGRGKARSYVLRHQHEHQRGQTSSVAFELLGFSSNQTQVFPSSVRTQALHQSNPLKPTIAHNKEFYEIATTAEHRCTLVDLCGHEKYLKTTIYGLTGMAPDCAMIIVGANNGIQQMTREHLGLCCALRVPFFVIVTKIDMCPENVFKDTQMRVKRVLSRAGRKAFYVRDMETDVPKAVQFIIHNQGFSSFAPVFEISAVKGTNLDLLREFIKMMTISYNNSDLALKKTSGLKLNNREENEEKDDETQSVDSLENDAFVTQFHSLNIKNESDESGSERTSLKDFKNMTEFYIDDIFQVQGVGIVIGGTLRNGGSLAVGDKLLIGPDKTGYYRPVTLKSIHRQCVPSEKVFTGQHATFNIKAASGQGRHKEALKKTYFRKGMVCAKDLHPQVSTLSLLKSHTVREFEAVIKVLHHSTTIGPGYSPMLHLGVVRQAATILSIKDKDGQECVARTGSEVLVRFKFVYYAEFIKKHNRVVFREGRSKGCGIVVRVIDPKVTTSVHSSNMNRTVELDTSDANETQN